MNYYIFVWVILAVLFSIWTVQVVPSKSILSRYPYNKLIIGIIFPSALSKKDIDYRDLENIEKFFFRLRIWCLFILGSIVLVSFASSFTTNNQLMELQNLVEKAEKTK